MIDKINFSQKTICLSVLVLFVLTGNTALALPQMTDRCASYLVDIMPVGASNELALQKFRAQYKSQFNISDEIIAVLEKLDETIATIDAKVENGQSLIKSENNQNIFVGDSIYKIQGKLRATRDRIHKKIIELVQEGILVSEDRELIQRLRADGVTSQKDIEELIRDSDLENRVISTRANIETLHETITEELFKAFFAEREFTRVTLRVRWQKLPGTTYTKQLGSLRDFAMGLRARLYEQARNGLVFESEINELDAVFHISGPSAYVFLLNSIGRYHVVFNDGNKPRTHYFIVSGGADTNPPPEFKPENFRSAFEIFNTGEKLEIRNFQNLGAGGQNAQTSNNGRELRYTPPSKYIEILPGMTEVRGQYYGRSVQESLNIAIDNLSENYNQWRRAVIRAQEVQSEKRAFEIVDINNVETTTPISISLINSSVAPYPYGPVNSENSEREKAILFRIYQELEKIE